MGVRRRRGREMRRHIGGRQLLLPAWHLAGAGKRGAVTAALLAHLPQRATSAPPAPGIALGRS